MADKSEAEGYLVTEKLVKRFDEALAVDDVSLSIGKGEIFALLGSSGCGKSTLLRMLAGLENPTSGRILLGGQDMANLPPYDRPINMMFQSYALFPHLDVWENIAFGLKREGLPKAEIQQRVDEMLDLVQLGPFAKRKPHQLSGGQQQRVALARALAKGAPLMLLDEPLVNLDYKLREELRDELSALFAEGNSTVIYATTEPGEALLLGGYTAVMDEGELLQYGPTAEVFHKPKSLRVARAFSDPPMNLLAASAAATGVQLNGGPLLPLALPATTSRKFTVGLRASALRVQAQDGDVDLPGKVELAEISGSDTFVHVATLVGEVVAQLTGVHYFELGAQVTLYLSPAQVYIFDEQGMLLLAPVRGGGR